MNETINNDSNLSNKGEVLLIDKPLDWTSFDVVKKIRLLLSVKKVGHAGTLDPKATGLLILCTGDKTKSIDQFIGLDKEYVGTAQLGIKTPSYDTETEVIERSDYTAINKQKIDEAVSQFLGKQYQTPPMYSAAKYCGRPLYHYARENKSVERLAKEIEIKRFEILDFNKPLIRFKIVCSKGTYIRSLINDFGNYLGCGATLIALRRVRIGEYNVTEAKTIQQFVDERKKN